MLEEVKQLRQLEKGSFSITTERSINWVVGKHSAVPAMSCDGQNCFFMY